MVILLILLGLFIIVFINSINTNEKKKQYEKEQELRRKFAPEIIDKTVWKNEIKLGASISYQINNSSNEYCCIRCIYLDFKGEKSLLNSNPWGYKRGQIVAIHKLMKDNMEIIDPNIRATIIDKYFKYLKGIPFYSSFTIDYSYIKGDGVFRYFSTLIYNSYYDPPEHRYSGIAVDIYNKRIGIDYIKKEALFHDILSIDSKFEIDNNKLIVQHTQPETFIKLDKVSHVEEYLNEIKKIDIDKNIETENPFNKSNIPKILPTNTLSNLIKPYQTTEYLHPLWKEKREQIIRKEGYTCQKCRKFNPAAGMIINYIPTAIWGDDNFLFDYECHEYDIYKSIYHYRFGEISLDIEFGEHKLVMPELHVHHKKYIEGRKLWEYEDNDLETLCFECHKEKHRQSKIPIYNSYNQIINYVEEKDITNPNYTRNPLRDFPSWTFVHKKGNTYEASKKEDIRPTLSGVILGDFPVNSDGELNEELNKELNEKLFSFYVKFMQKYIPNFI